MKLRINVLDTLIKKRIVRIAILLVLFAYVVNSAIDHFNKYYGHTLQVFPYLIVVFVGWLILRELRSKNSSYFESYKNKNEN
jgi:ABC-type nickel/cobalt efflux system permease component RcnA